MPLNGTITELETDAAGKPIGGDITLAHDSKALYPSHDTLHFTTDQFKSGSPVAGRLVHFDVKDGNAYNIYPDHIKNPSVTAPPGMTVSAHGAESRRLIGADASVGM